MRLRSLVNLAGTEKLFSMSLIIAMPDFGPRRRSFYNQKRYNQPKLPVARATKKLRFRIPSSLTRSTVALTRSNCRCAHLAVLMHTSKLRDESSLTGAAPWSSS